MRIFLAVNMAVFKNSSCRAKNKIGSAFYVAFVIILFCSCTTAKQHILIPNNITIVKAGPATKNKKGYCLPCSKSGVILESNIGGMKIIGINKK